MIAREREFPMALWNYNNIFIVNRDTQYKAWKLPRRTGCPVILRRSGHCLRERQTGRRKQETILIVDDDPDISYLIKLFLDRKGYPNIIASGGQECLDILKKERPGVILLDVLMAPMDGWKTLEHIKKDPLTKNIPALILTGKAITPAEARQYNICIEDYVMKPFGQNDLYAAVEQVLMRKRKIEESIVLAKKAGIDKEMFCEFAKLSKRVSVNRKLIGMLEKNYRGRCGRRSPTARQGRS